MSLILVGQLGAIPFHEIKCPGGYHVPTISLKEVNVPGMVGDLDMWDNYKSKPSLIRTKTFCTRDVDAPSYENLAISYPGTLFNFGVINGRSLNDEFIAKVIELKEHTIDAAFVDGASNVNVCLTCVWVMKLYRIN